MSDFDNALHHINVSKLSSAIEKKASFWRNFTKSLSSSNLGKQMGDAILTAGAGAAITGIGVGAKAGFEAVREKVEKPRAFKGMMGAMPGLKKEDPKAVQMTFNTLYGMNRRMAKDPLVAGSFVAKHVNRADIGGEGGAYVDPQTTKLLMDAGSRGREEGPMFRAFQKGASADLDKVEKFRAQLRKIRGK